jgi:hypothetical protein
MPPNSTRPDRSGRTSSGPWPTWPNNITQLTTVVKTRLKRLQYRPGLLDGFLASTGLDLTPFCNLHH